MSRLKLLNKEQIVVARVAEKNPLNTQPHSRIVKAFASKKIVLTIQVGTVRYKAFQVVFPPDGSLFVTFPYFRHRTGILAAATIPANGQTSSQVDLQLGGQIASHDVKYSHHTDGRAHFSQDGKVFTVVKRQSIALEKYQGHIFSVLIQGVEGFDRADDLKDTGYTPNRTTLTFGFATPPDAVKFVGRWYDVAKLPLGGQQQSSVGPNLNLISPSGEQLPGLLVASPLDIAHVLCISCQPILRLGPEPEFLIFYGGFDAREIMDNTACVAGFLAFIYPASNAEDLKKIIGTIDR